MKTRISVLVILTLTSIFIACASIPPTNSSQDTPMPTNGTTLNPTPSPAPVSTPTPTPSNLPSPVPVPTTMPIATSTSTPTGNPTEMPTPTGLKIATLSIINKNEKVISLEVEIASTPEKLQAGLMYRTSLPEMQGMLFDFGLYGDTVDIPFYMRNTYIPLSIAFVSKDGVIVDIQDMEPLTETFHYPKKPYRYAIEVNKGWFDNHGIIIGARVKF